MNFFKKVVKAASKKLNVDEVNKIKNNVEKNLIQIGERVAGISEKIVSENVTNFNQMIAGPSRQEEPIVEAPSHFPAEPHVVIKFCDSSFNDFFPQSDLLESLTVTGCPSIKQAHKLLSKVDFCNQFSVSSKPLVVVFKIDEKISDEKIEKSDAVFNGVVIFESTVNEAYFIMWKSASMENCVSLKLFETNIKELKTFTGDFIVKSVRENFSALPSDVNLNSDFTINLTSLIDHRGYNLLMLASEAGNLQVVNELLSIGFSVNSSINGKSAVDLAWESQHQNIVLTLLKADSKYPKDFHKDFHTDNLKNFIDDIQNFFNAIEENLTEIIQEFLVKNPNLRYIYNTENVSASAKTLKLLKFDIYEILLNFNVFMSPDEEIEDITSDFDYDELEILKNIHQKSAKEDPEKHIKILTAISKTGHDELKVEERIKIIEEAYRALNKIEDVQPLLKAVAECRNATVYFDFNRIWVNFMDPSFGTGTNGAFYPNSGRVYIAAKELLDPAKRNEALGVIAHEFCHFAVYLGFNNLAKPYEKNDKERENYFNEICGDYRRKLNNVEVISDVFYYAPNQYHAEMIVRAPQLMTLYRDNPEILERFREEKYSRLFAYFSDVVLPRVKSSISSVENFLIEQLKNKLETYESEIQFKNDKLDEMEEEMVNERCKTQFGRLGVSSCLNRNSPVHVMEIRNVDGKKEFYNKYRVIDDILLQPEVRDRKVVVVSIIGEYRKGKSFFLDYCLRFLNANYASVSKMSKPSCSSNWMGDGDEPLSGFSWKHGRAPDTKGILFWPDVFLHEDDSGEKIAIIIMDTQGLFEIGSTFQENARIFSLSTLISSIQIVNIQGVMHEYLIEYLEMATNLTKFISQKKISGEKPSWKPFQNLLFLLRDWADEEVGFNYDGGEKYLNEFLNIEQNSNTKAQTVRNNISASFDIIKCFLLNNPGLGVLKGEFNGQWSKLHHDFVTNLRILIESILRPENLIKKSILGKEVTSTEFRDFIFTYFKAFRSAELPENENILQMMIENQMKVIVSDQIKIYQNLMNDKIEFDHENFENYLQVKHNNAKEESVTGFLTAEKLEDETSIEKFIKILQTEIESAFRTLKVLIMRDYQRYQQNKEIVEKLQADIQKQIQESVSKQIAYEEEIKNQQQSTQALNLQIAALTASEREKQMRMEKFQQELTKSKTAMSENKDEDVLKNLKTQMRNMDFSGVGDWVEKSVKKLFK